MCHEFKVTLHVAGSTLLAIVLMLVSIVACGGSRIEHESDDTVSTTEFGTVNAIKRGERITRLDDLGRTYIILVEGGKQCYWSKRKTFGLGPDKTKYILQRSDYDYHAIVILRHSPYYWCEDL